MPVFTLREIVELEYRAWHRDDAGRVDFIYDGITFWQQQGALWSPQAHGPLPMAGWHHKRDCRCPRCREAWREGRAA